MVFIEVAPIAELRWTQASSTRNAADMSSRTSRFRAAAFSVTYFVQRPRIVALSLEDLVARREAPLCGGFRPGETHEES